MAAALPNDNRVPAGRMSGDTLDLRLSVVPSRWFLLGEGNPAFNVVAFAEEGKAPAIPGPLIRVRIGTVVHVTLRNTVSWPAPSSSIHRDRPLAIGYSS
ncbi:MAG: hypothetical protein ACREUF_09455 [Solimonas sp.]